MKTDTKTETEADIERLEGPTNTETHTVRDRDKGERHRGPLLRDAMTEAGN